MITIMLENANDEPVLLNADDFRIAVPVATNPAYTSVHLKNDNMVLTVKQSPQEIQHLVYTESLRLSAPGAVPEPLVETQRDMRTPEEKQKWKKLDTGLRKMRLGKDFPTNAPK